MTNNIKIVKILLPMLIIAALFSSCGEGTTSRLTTELAEAEDYLLSSYFMLRGDEKLDESRAAWDYTETVTLPTTAGEISTDKSTNYPEKGQKTTVTISFEESYPDDVYKVVNYTTYPNRESITSTTESYYIIDYPSGSPDGVYDATEDPICDSDGTLNPLSRIEFTTIYDDGTERTETIEYAAPTTEGTYTYAEFDIDGTLDFPVYSDESTWGGGEFYDEGTKWMPGTGDAVWSSMVSYEETVEYDLWFWSYTKHVVGVRYYTEQGSSDDGDLVRSSVTYERTIAVSGLDTDNSLGDYVDWFIRLWEDKNDDSTGSADNTTYSETVIRKRIEGSKKTEMNSETKVYDDTGDTIVIFSAEYETDEDGVATEEGDPVAVYY